MERMTLGMIGGCIDDTNARACLRKVAFRNTSIHFETGTGRTTLVRCHWGCLPGKRSSPVSVSNVARWVLAQKMWLDLCVQNSPAHQARAVALLTGIAPLKSNTGASIAAIAAFISISQDRNFQTKKPEVTLKSLILGTI